MAFVNPQNRDLSNPDPTTIPGSDIRSPRTIDSLRFSIPWIKRLRLETGLGLKESKDILDGINGLIRGEAISEAHRSLMIVEGAEWTRRGMAAEELAKATRELVTLREQAAAARKCVTCGIHLEDDEVGACSTYCFTEHRQKVSDQRRVEEIGRQITDLKRDISDLEQERSFINERLHPEANEDAPYLDLDADYMPF